VIANQGECARHRSDALEGLAPEGHDLHVHDRVVVVLVAHEDHVVRFLPPDGLDDPLYEGLAVFQLVRNRVRVTD
jgi:hypothetical protein